MKKGKFGILLSYYGVLAFALVILRQPILCAAVMLVAVLFEKDEWLGRQTIQAFLLSVTVSFFYSGALSSLLSYMSYTFIFGALSTVFTIIGGLIYIAAIVFSVIGIIHNLKGEEAGIPLFSQLANKAYGKAVPKYTSPFNQQSPQGYPVPPANTPPPSASTGYVPPQQPSAPAAPPPYQQGQSAQQTPPAAPSPYGQNNPQDSNRG